MEWFKNSGLQLGKAVCTACIIEHPEWDAGFVDLVRSIKPDWPNMPGLHPQVDAREPYGYPASDPVWDESRKYWDQFAVVCVTYEYDDAEISLCVTHLEASVSMIVQSYSNEAVPSRYMHRNIRDKNIRKEYRTIAPGPGGAVINISDVVNGYRMVAYRSVDTNQLYVCNESEFNDHGRFIRLE